LKVLVVTGRLAEEAVRATVKGFRGAEVLALPVSVASFITPGFAAAVLGEMSLEGYDMILLPGTVNGDISPVEEATGVPTYKGPLHFADLPLVLASDVQLSRTIPATELIKDSTTRRAHETVEAAERDWRSIMSERGGLTIGGEGRLMHVSDGLPMRVIAEIVNAPTLSLGEVAERARYYASQGADAIDIGMLAGDPKPETIGPIVAAIREAVSLPISIDTLNPDEISAAVDAGVDLILSLDAGNLEAVAPYIAGQAVVILPTDMSRGHLPRTPEARVKALEENIERAVELGLHRIIGDLVVEPLLRPGLMDALESYRRFRALHPEVPLLFGVGNATELIDADSQGVNAALTALAREAGANMLHVPEYSVKARGSVAEVVRASRMMYLAEAKGTAPKDLGLDLLMLKEKRWREEAYDAGVESRAQVVHGVGENDFKPDKAGWFKVQVDREAGEIVAAHYRPGEDEPSTVIRGGDAREVYQTIIRLNLVSKLDHAAYLGRELERAALALKLGRSYTQDEELF
jgi:dihydropteroate synthase-like protein